MSWLSEDSIHASYPLDWTSDIVSFSDVALTTVQSKKGWRENIMKRKNCDTYVKMGFSNLRDSGICAMNNFEFWRQISLLLFVVCF